MIKEKAKLEYFAAVEEEGSKRRLLPILTNAQRMKEMEGWIV